MVKISIIIVNYNTSKQTVSLITKLKSLKDSEIILLDNNSKDGFDRLLSKINKLHKNIKILLNNENLGFSKSVNKGVSISEGDYLLILNPDISITSNQVENLLQHIEKIDQDAILAPRLLNENGTVQASCYKKQSLFNAIKEFWLGIKNSYSKYYPESSYPTRVYSAVAACWFMEKKTFNSVGKLDEKFKLYFEDLEFCDRANKKGIPIIYLPHIQVVHTHGLSAKTNQQSSALLNESATKYHGKIKKYIIDIIIRTSNILSHPITSKKIIILLTLWIGAIHAFAAVGYLILPAVRFPSELIGDLWSNNYLLWSWANFDGEHYLSIARYGYQLRDTFPQYAFFPLYPLLIHLFSKITTDYYISARLISIISMFFLVKYLSKWLAVLKNINISRFILFFLFLPGAFYLQSIYTESLFLALTAYSFYKMEKSDYPKSTIAIMFATASRVNGLILWISYVHHLIEKRIGLSKTLLHSFISSLGFMIYSFYLYLITGDPLKFYRAQDSWGKSDPTSPIVTFTNYFKAITINFSLDLTHFVVIIEVLVTLFLIYSLYKTYKSRLLNTTYLLFSAGMILLPIITGSLGSMPRFMLAAFPAFVYISKSNKYYLLLLISLLMLISGTILFTRGYWYA